MKCRLFTFTYRIWKCGVDIDEVPPDLSEWDDRGAPIHLASQKVEFAHFVSFSFSLFPSLSFLPMNLFLRLISFQGRVECLRCLVALGADVNSQRNFLRNSPLHLTCEYNNPQCLEVSFSLSLNNTHFQSPLSLTPLLWAGSPQWGRSGDGEERIRRHTEGSRPATQWGLSQNFKEFRKEVSGYGRKHCKREGIKTIFIQICKNTIFWEIFTRSFGVHFNPNCLLNLDASLHTSSLCMSKECCRQLCERNEKRRSENQFFRNPLSLSFSCVQPASTIW